MSIGLRVAHRFGRRTSVFTCKLSFSCCRVMSSLSESFQEYVSSMDHSDDIFWFHEVDSTMDKARQLLKENEFKSKKSFAVVGDYQTAGRGTRGRNWVSTIGNLYMTLVINLSDVPLPLTLIPIRVGTFIIKAVDSALQRFGSDSEQGDSKISKERPCVQLKWPNDVLIDGDKISGVLIEVENKKLLIGIGCNITTAPTSPESGPDSGCRPANHLSSFISARDEENINLYIRNFMVSDIYNSAQCWVSGNMSDNAESAIFDFEMRMDKSWQVSTFSS